jgi:hypothetical protein
MTYWDNHDGERKPCLESLVIHHLQGLPVARTHVEEREFQGCFEEVGKEDFLVKGVLFHDQSN